MDQAHATQLRGEIGESESEFTGWIECFKEVGGEEWTGRDSCDEKVQGKEQRLDQEEEGSFVQCGKGILVGRRGT